LQRKIAVMTGTRADFGLLRPLMTEIARRPDADLLIIATGTHLSEAHGSTVTEITAAGFDISAEVSIWSADDSSLAAAVDTGAAVSSFAKTLASLNPDVVVVLGDRLEAFAMASAALVMQIPVAHIHGGELTLGAMDDSLRHAITKMSYLHFTTTAEHQARVISLGENPSRVYNFGAPVLDVLASMNFMKKVEIEAKFGVKFGTRTGLMTFHPAAFDEAPAAEMFSEILAAIDAVPEINFIFTGTNNDIGSDAVREMMKSFVGMRGDRISYVESFGQLGYLSAMREVDLVLGNSSSTVLEAPILGTPSVLVGNRQEGRPLGESVFKVSADRGEILNAIKAAVVCGQEPVSHPFGRAGFAEKAAEALATHKFGVPLKKNFYEG
jgi:UDP-hydrolysing UDP-N-acetyl-D-glucosamine 2-epimerase